MIIACGSVCYRDYSLARALKGIANAGFEYVELLSIPNWISKEHVSPETGEDGIQKVEKLLNEYGLTAISLSGHIDFLVKEARDTRIAMNALKTRIELASKLGCKYVNTGAWTKEKQVFYQTTDELIDCCKKYNITLGLEVGEPGLTATGTELAELLKPVKARNIGINYDTGNIRWLTGIEPERDLPRAIERLVHMHLKDQAGGKDKWDFPPLGDGEVNFTSVFDIVNKSGFEGPFTVEVETSSEDPTQRDHEVKRCHDFLTRYLQ